MFFIMINHEQTADDAKTLDEARRKAKDLCDNEPIPSVWSIYDEAGRHIEDVVRTDGRTLSDQVRDLNARIDSGNPTERPR